MIKYVRFILNDRYTTVLLGMFALDYLEISFTETVKSTAPAFTVIISRMLLGKFCYIGDFFVSTQKTSIYQLFIILLFPTFNISNFRRNYWLLCEAFVDSCNGWASVVLGE